MLGVRCDVDIFKLTASAQSIYREVYALMLLDARSPDNEWKNNFYFANSGFDRDMSNKIYKLNELH